MKMTTQVQASTMSAVMPSGELFRYTARYLGFRETTRDRPDSPPSEGPAGTRLRLTNLFCPHRHVLRLVEACGARRDRREKLTAKGEAYARHHREILHPAANL